MTRRKRLSIPLLIALVGMLGGLIGFYTARSAPSPPPEEPASLMPTETTRPEDGLSAATATAPPMVRIKSGPNPLWFELGYTEAGAQGPQWIASPAEAALRPFTPWPLAPFIAGMAIHDRGLTLAVNREGFLVLLPESEERIGLYRIADVSYWKHYTVGSLFVFQGAPAVLLYRDTFFADPIDSPPDPQVFTPVRGASQPRGLRVPAFDTLPQAWEVEGLRFAQDGYWYYRGIRREAPQSVCMRSADLIRPGEAVSLGAWRNAALPEPLDRAPPVLRLALEATFALSGKDRLNVAAIISPDFPTARRFASQTALSSDGEEPVVELHGFYIPGAGALVILPDGRGMVADALGLEEGTARQVSCPPLPEGFVYTAIAPLGDTLVAAWEEQQDWNVGSAGLMLFRPVRDYASKAEAYKR